MCDRLRCEKTGQPINPDCFDCWKPADGPEPEMFGKGYAERCANCNSYEKCLAEDSHTWPNGWCEDWREKCR